MGFRGEKGYLFYIGFSIKMNKLKNNQTFDRLVIFLLEFNKKTRLSMKIFTP